MFYVFPLEGLTSPRTRSFLVLPKHPTSTTPAVRLGDVFSLTFRRNCLRTGFRLLSSHLAQVSESPLSV